MISQMTVPSHVDIALRDWQACCALSDEVVARVHEALADHAFGQAQACVVDTYSADWQKALREAGVPCYGSPEIGPELMELESGSSQLVAELSDGVLHLPSLGGLQRASGLDLKPVRAWVGQHFSWRPQLAPGVWLIVSDAMALLLSTRNVVLGGFLHHGHERRYSVTLKPFGFQIFEL